MNVNLSAGWGVVRTIADLCFAQPEGKYVLIKDPNKVSRVRHSRPERLLTVMCRAAYGPFVPCAV